MRLLASLDMDSVDLEVLKKAAEWASSRYVATLCTVTRTWGSAPRPIGAMMLIRDDGRVVGSVSGGCIEDDLVDRVRSGQLALTKPAVEIYGVSGDDARRFGLPCGGTLQLVLEPITQDNTARIQLALDLLAQGKLVRRTLDVESGKVDVRIVDHNDAGKECEFNGYLLVSTYGPRYRLLIIGGGQLSSYLAQVAQGLDYQVTVCDPREEYAEGWNVPGATLVRSMPDDTVIEMRLDARSAVVALTHDPKLDDMALLEALKSPAFYIGAIGSRANNAKRRERLALFDLTPPQIARLHGPIGLFIGSRTPPEIAISILAEMTAIRNGVAVAQTHDSLRERAKEAAGCSI